MNFDLLNVNLLLWTCIAFVTLAMYTTLTLYHTGPKEKLRGRKKIKAYQEKNHRVFGGGLLAAMLVASLLTFTAGNVTGGQLPPGITLMCLPFTLSILMLTIAISFKRHTLLIGLSAAVLPIGLVFSLLLINGYYRYYHTIGNVFGEVNAQTFAQGQNTVTVRYTVAVNQDAYNRNSLQGSLDSFAAAPTAGSVYKVNIPGIVSKFKARPAYIYVPAIYTSPAQVNLPVIVLTAGVPGNPSDWVGLGIKDIMDQFAKSHEGITPLVVMADSSGTFNNDTECVDSSRGNVETYLTQDVPDYVMQHFNVDTSPHNWALGGLSMGGMCALMLTLRHPDIYSYFIDLGGEGAPEVGSKEKTIAALFGGSETAWASHQPDLLLAQKKYKNQGGFFGDGDQDNRVVTDALAGLNIQSKAAGLDTVSETISGAHTFNVWAQTYKDALPWISNRIGATRCSAACL